MTLTTDEQKILEAYRKAKEGGFDFTLILQHEILETGGGITLIKRACPTRVYEISRALYNFANNIRKINAAHNNLFLLEISDQIIQIFDVRPQD